MLESNATGAPHISESGFLTIQLIDMSGIDDAYASRPIEWGLIPARVARVLDMLITRHNPLGVASEFFSLDLLRGLTMSDLADARNVGPKRMKDVIQFLDHFVNSELLPMTQVPNKESTVEVIVTQHTFSRPFPDDFIFSKEIVNIYGGSDRTTTCLRAYGITNPKQLNDWLSLEAHVGTPDNCTILRSFHRDLASHLSNFEPVTKWLLLRSRLLIGKHDWNTFTMTEYGFTSDRLYQAFPKLETKVQAFELYSAGFTYREVSNEIGLTYQRVQQIVQQVRQVMTEHDSADLLIHTMQLAEETNAKYEKLEVELKSRIRIRIVNSPGIALTILAAEEGRDLMEMKRQVPKDLRKFVDGFSNPHGKRGDRISKEHLLDSVRLAGTFHFPLAAPQFDELVTIGEVPGPGSPTVAKRFGTWKKACEKAGVEHTSRGRDYYEPKWSWDEIVGCVAEYLLDPQTCGSARGYEDWRIEQSNEVPSLGHVRNEMDTWIDAVSYALIRVGEMGPLDADIYLSPGEGY